jgi:hypothetical protein
MSCMRFRASAAVGSVMRARRRAGTTPAGVESEELALWKEVV